MTMAASTITLKLIKQVMCNIKEKLTPVKAGHFLILATLGNQSF